MTTENIVLILFSEAILTGIVMTWVVIRFNREGRLKKELEESEARNVAKQEMLDNRGALAEEKRGHDMRMIRDQLKETENLCREMTDTVRSIDRMVDNATYIPRHNKEAKMERFRALHNLYRHEHQRVNGWYVEDPDPDSFSNRCTKDNLATLKYRQIIY